MTLPERAKNLQDDGEALDEALQAVMTRYSALTRQGRRHGAIGARPHGRLVTGSWRSWPPPLGKGRRMKTADAVEAVVEAEVAESPALPPSMVCGLCAPPGGNAGRYRRWRLCRGGCSSARTVRAGEGNYNRCYDGNQAARSNAAKTS